MGTPRSRQAGTRLQLKEEVEAGVTFTSDPQESLQVHGTVPPSLSATCPYRNTPEDTRRHRMSHLGIRSKGNLS